MTTFAKLLNFVTPAKAGAHPRRFGPVPVLKGKLHGRVMGPRLRGGDDCVLMVCIVILLAAIPVPLSAQGSGPTPELANRQLENPAQEAEATRLMHSLRCIQCQGQSIGDSDASMAQTMRAEVRQQIAKGQKPEAVRQWMIERYGKWVSFEPEMKGAGLLLWVAPLLLLLVALLLAHGLFRRRT